MIVVSDHDINRCPRQPHGNDRSVIAFLAIHRRSRLTAMMQHSNIEIDRFTVCIQSHPQTQRNLFVLRTGHQPVASGWIVDRGEQNALGQRRQSQYLS